MANDVEIGVEMDRVLVVMPWPRSIEDTDAAAKVYAAALRPFPVEIIREAFDRYLSGGFEKLSRKTCPRPPELGDICRVVQSEHNQAYERIRRAEERDRERAEAAETEKLLNKTPEQKERARAKYAEFLASNESARMEDARKRRPGAVERSTDPEIRKRQREVTFEDRPSAEIRHEYGMTAEKLAKVKNRPLPKGMAALASAAAAAMPVAHSGHDGQNGPPSMKPKKPDDYGGLP